MLTSEVAMVFVPVPVGRKYTATAHGRVIKSETCEGCGTKFVYLMKRSATAYGSSPLWLNNAGAEERAEGGAHRELMKKLERENDLIACPACGRFQRRMVWR